MYMYLLSLWLDTKKRYCEHYSYVHVPGDFKGGKADTPPWVYIIIMYSHVDCILGTMYIH